MKYKVFDMTNDKRCIAFIKENWNILAADMNKGFCYEQGDALVIRDILQEEGFIFGKDFYLKKEDN